MSLRAQRARAPDRPLGGTSGAWRGRFLRFHVPLAIACIGLLVLFMTLPIFDPLGYVRMDMESGSAVPRPMDMSAPRPDRPMESQGTGHAGTAPAAGHSAGQTPAPDHSTAPAPSSGHGGSQTSAPAAHGGDKAGTRPDTLDPARAQSRFDQRLTVATGYVATLLLAFTLLVGPANLLLRRRNPVSSYLRRDAGMWTATFSVLHVIVGLQVHSQGQISGMLGYFLAPDRSPLLNSFGLANWTGLAATVIVVGLLTISGDLALRTLKAGTWKWLQRLNYALFALVVMHAVLYGALLRATSPFTLMLALSVIAVLAAQTIGIWLWRRKRSRTTVLAA